MKHTSINNITGARLVSKPTDQAYRDNYDLIFRKKDKEEETPTQSINNESGTELTKCNPKDKICQTS